MNKVKLLFKLFGNLFIYVIAKVIPKKNNLWVFGAWFGTKYSDNPKAFFEYINSQQKQIDAIWISKDKVVIQQVRDLGYKAYYHTSLFGCWCQLRAQFSFVCQALQDDLFAPCISNKTKVVNLWHGLPLKKIMYDVFGDRYIQKNLVGRFFDVLSPYEKRRNDFIIATSLFTQELLANAFRLEKKQTLITGFPRNDVFFNQVSTKKSDLSFKCIYMPTFRGGIDSECDLFSLYGFKFNEIEKQLIKNKVELTLRMHPVNTPPKYLVNLINKSSVIHFDAGSDIYQTISNYDCLITDYSSIYFDFLLSNKPIVFAPFDLEHYKKNERSLYFEFSEVTLSPYSMNWQDVITRILEIKNNHISSEYIDSYEKLNVKFHALQTKSESPFSSELFDQLLKL